MCLLISVVPNITTSHGRTALRVGEMLAIPCIAEGFPPPTVSWTHNGTVLPICTVELVFMQIVCAEPPRSQTPGRDSSLGLLILSAKLSDAGPYACIAENSAGVAAYEVFLNVERATSMYIIYQCYSS